MSSKYQKFLLQKREIVSKNIVYNNNNNNSSPCCNCDCKKPICKNLFKSCDCDCDCDCKNIFKGCDCDCIICDCETIFKGIIIVITTIILSVICILANIATLAYFVSFGWLCMVVNSCDGSRGHDFFCAPYLYYFHPWKWLCNIIDDIKSM